VGSLALALSALALVGCPHDASLGTVSFDRGGARHAVSLADCADRIVRKPRRPAAPAALRSRTGRIARVVVARKPGARFGTQTIAVDGRAVRIVREDYRRIPAGAPGPLGLVSWSPDGRWLFFSIDPMGSASIAADGLELQALHVRDGRVVPVAGMLISSDHMTWCGSTLVLTAGGDRIATHHKRLVVAQAPDWKPRALWSDRRRAFGSVACARDGESVAVLSQPASADANFFHTRWQLWRVGLDGSRRMLDAPPAGWADESPRWSRDGRALLFVRERQGRGRLMLWRRGGVTGPFANLGYSLGYYGHHDWWANASWTAGA